MKIAYLCETVLCTNIRIATWIINTHNANREIGYRYLSMIKYPPQNLTLYVFDKLKQKQKLSPQ